MSKKLTLLSLTLQCPVDLAAVGKRVLSIRSAEGLSRSSLAQMAHYLTESKISQLEKNGKGTLETIYAIAVALEVDFKELAELPKPGGDCMSPPMTNMKDSKFVMKGCS